MTAHEKLSRIVALHTVNDSHTLSWDTWSHALSGMALASIAETFRMLARQYCWNNYFKRLEDDPWPYRPTEPTPPPAKPE